MSLNNFIRPFTAPAVKPYTIGGLIIFLLLVVIPAGVLLPLNTIAMWKTIGLTTIVVTALVWFVGIAPLAVTYAGLLGGLWNVLQKKAFGAGAGNGIEILFKALILATFVFVMEGTAATFVWFGANTSAYIGLMVIGLASVLLGLQFKIEAGMMGWVLGAFLALFAILSVFGVRLAIPAERSFETAAAISSLGDTAKESFSGLDNIECPEEVLSVVYGTRITVPFGCKVDVDATLVRNGDFEYEFADESLPLVNGKRMLNGKPIEAYLTHSFAYAGRDRFGMRFTTTSRSNFEAAEVSEVEVIILEKGATGAKGLSLSAE